MRNNYATVNMSNIFEFMRSGRIRRVGISACSAGSHCLASMDSDLGAGSRNSTDGSFAVLAFQLAAFTKNLNEVFLSY